MFLPSLATFRPEACLIESSAVLAACNSRRIHICADYALIAASSGWMPMMFMTRVRL
jgi:hypothetical protein